MVRGDGVRFVDLGLSIYEDDGWWMDGCGWTNALLSACRIRIRFRFSQPIILPCEEKPWKGLVLVSYRYLGIYIDAPRL